MHPADEELEYRENRKYLMSTMAALCMILRGYGPKSEDDPQFPMQLPAPAPGFDSVERRPAVSRPGP